jgi:four helix bundle protein
MRQEIKKSKLLSFEDVPVWKDSIDLTLQVYKITKTFPEDEKYGLSSQMRRAVSSISANIAEGFGRNGNKEKFQFYSIAYGSLLETKSFLYLSQKLGYSEDIKLLIEQAVILQKQINAIKSSLKLRKS